MTDPENKRPRLSPPMIRPIIIWALIALLAAALLDEP